MSIYGACEHLQYDVLSVEDHLALFLFTSTAQVVGCPLISVSHLHWKHTLRRLLLVPVDYFSQRHSLWNLRVRKNDLETSGFLPSLNRSEWWSTQCSENDPFSARQFAYYAKCCNWVEISADFHLQLGTKEKSSSAFSYISRQSSRSASS